MQCLIAPEVQEFGPGFWSLSPVHDHTKQGVSPGVETMAWGVFAVSMLFPHKNFTKGVAYKVQ